MANIIIFLSRFLNDNRLNLIALAKHD